MRLEIIIVAVGVLASVSHSASAQTVDAFGNCVSSTGVASADAGLFTLQSPVVSSRAIPATAQLLSSRIVSTGIVPATQLNSFSTFGATSVPVGTQFQNNSAGLALAPRTFGFAPAARGFSFAPTVGVPATMSFPSTSFLSNSSTLTLSTPQVLTTSPLAAMSPGVATFLANRIASENSLSSAATILSPSTGCCSAKSLQNIEDRINALDAIFARLEKSSRASGSGGSGDELDELLGESPDDQLAPSPVKDEIDDLLQDTIE
ncbi:MAG: hypothetical protein ACI8P0_006786 [Planctomycetaceae bacterium]|jgi:hypothetical protein